ncbi:uncharacterized protein LOC105356804 [Oryzias latipes]
MSFLLQTKRQRTAHHHLLRPHQHNHHHFCYSHRGVRHPHLPEAEDCTYIDWEDSFEIPWRGCHVLVEDADEVQLQQVPLTPTVIVCGQSCFSPRRFMLIWNRSIVHNNIAALCLMFRSYFCFNSHYPTELASTLEFLQRAAHPWSLRSTSLPDFQLITWTSLCPEMCHSTWLGTN